MIDNPHKIVLTSPEGRQFIRYKHKKAEVFIEVLEFDAPEILRHKHEQLKEWHEENNLPFLTGTKSFDDKHYLLVAVDVIYIQPRTKKIDETLYHRVKKLADWFMYNHLLPESKQNGNQQNGSQFV